MPLSPEVNDIENQENLKKAISAVVKLGGSEGNDSRAVCKDIASLIKEGRLFVIVHGVSASFNQALEKSGNQPKFADSEVQPGVKIRIVDEKTIKIFAEACAQERQNILTILSDFGVNVLGLPDQDNNYVLQAQPSIHRVILEGKRIVLRHNLTGTVKSIEKQLLLKNFIGRNIVPVISPLGRSKDGVVLDIDGDQAAAVLAASLGTKLIILSNVPGLLLDPKDPTSLIQTVNLTKRHEIQSFAQGRMTVKLQSVFWSLDNGATGAVIGNSSCPQPVRMALSEQQGTVFTP